MADTKGGTQTDILPLETGEGTALDRKMAHERELILGARDSPGETKLGTGQTVTEYREQQFAVDTAAEAKAAQLNREAMREQSTAGDPLYATDAVVQPTETGQAVILQPETSNAAGGAGEAKEGAGEGQGTGTGEGGKTPANSALPTSLPVDIPHRSKLAAAGVVSWTGLQGMGLADIEALPGLSIDEADAVHAYVVAHS